MADLIVRDLMTSRVFTVTPRDSLAKVYDLMDSLHVRHVPVVEKGGELVGLISLRDLVKEALFAEGDLPLSQARQLLEEWQAQDIMQEDVATIDPDETAAEAGRIMMEDKFNCLPVVEAGRLLGILTEGDFVNFVVKGQFSRAA